MTQIARLPLLLAALGLQAFVFAGPAAAVTATKPGPVDAECLSLAPDAAFPKTLSKYREGDSSRSVEDEARMNARASALEPIRKFVGTVDRIARRFEAAPDDGGAARCVISALAAWGEARALLDLPTEDAHLSRDVIVASLAGSYRRMAAAPVEAADRQAVERWLSEVGRDTVAFYRFKAGPKSRMNNHRYWAGVAVTAAGLASGDRDLMAWGADSFRIGLCQIRDDGTLPLELARGTKALQYHAYALRALAALDDLHTETGVATVDCQDRLSRLTRLVRDWSTGETNPTALRQETLKGDSLAFVRTVAFRQP